MLLYFPSLNNQNQNTDSNSSTSIISLQRRIPSEDGKFSDFQSVQINSGSEWFIRVPQGNLHTSSIVGLGTALVAALIGSRVAWVCYIEFGQHSINKRK